VTSPGGFALSRRSRAGPQLHRYANGCVCAVALREPPNGRPYLVVNGAMFACRMRIFSSVLVEGILCRNRGFFLGVNGLSVRRWAEDSRFLGDRFTSASFVSQSA